MRNLGRGLLLGVQQLVRPLAGVVSTVFSEAPTA
jgi:hypothetical protein